MIKLAKTAGLVMTLLAILAIANLFNAVPLVLTIFAAGYILLIFIVVLIVLIGLGS